MIRALSARTRRCLAVAAAVALFAWIARAFWMQDLRWSLPTPRPASVVELPLGSRPNLPGELRAVVTEGTPTLLHFFNPTCPCSRFNLEHVRELQKEFGERIRLVFVMQGEDSSELVEAMERLDFDAPFAIDERGEIADRFGVYSTPQAVVLDASGALAYRGNYNSSRYCVARESEYARLAVEDVLAGRPVRTFSAPATIAYGCSLPSDEDEGAR